MSTKDGNRASHRLSWLLRHGAIETGLAMDAAGWAEIREVLRVLGMSRGALEGTVADNTKDRFELRGTRVRACQGHSFAGTPVTLDGLEASWAREEDEGSIWHGTRLSAVPSIAKEGILPGERTHVHLAEALDSHVGKRAAVDVMLEVAKDRLAASGIHVFRSPNGVVLVRNVPAHAICGVVPMNDRARARERDIRSMLGL